MNDFPSNQEVLAQLKENKELLLKIYASTEKTRKLFLWTLIITVLLFILPIIGMIFAIPFFISNYIEPITGGVLGI